MTVEAVLKALSAKKRSEIQSWEEEKLKPCSHSVGLQQQEGVKLEGKALAHCKDCELQENLWLCLTCANLGCGRSQFGGIGGNGHGLAHYEATQHPLSVKMGSITPEGTADVFCYSHGDEILDPSLGEHLKRFGIALALQQKTEKTVAEMQLEQNLKFDFSMTTEDGKQFAPVFGPELTGLKNLGNSCYMASVLQAVFAVNAFKNHYVDVPLTHTQNCHEPPADCFLCQMGKLADGLLSGRYSIPVYAENGDQRGQDGISPSMFKNVIGKGHPEFATMRQQDAQEFLQHLLNVIEQKERNSGDPTKAFQFKVEQRLQCVQCEKVRYNSNSCSGLILPVPATILSVADDGKKQYAPLEFSKCLDSYFEQEMRPFSCPEDQEATSASFVQRVKQYPDVLVCTLSRFVLGDNWVMEKLNVVVNVPLTIDLAKYKSPGKQPDEVLLPEEAAAGPSIDQAALNQLMEMGFPENRCKRAIYKTGNSGADAAMAWLFEHMDDLDIDDPLDLTASSAESFNPTHVSQLMDMGFSDSQAKRALKETQNDVERAVTWLLSHIGQDMDEDVAPDVASSAQVRDADDTKLAVYDLLSFISHRGTSAQCGHYVAYVKRDDKWILYNDNKVVEVPDISQNIGEGYIYLFKRRS